MYSGEDKKLDNPVWFSLSETHERFAIEYDNLKCYNSEFCPFGGFVNAPDISNQMDEYASTCSNFFIVGNKPNFNTSLILNKELVCLQMILGNRIDLQVQEKIVKLNADYERNLLELVNLVQPGYFKNKTSLLGEYFGIFKDNKLVAVAGERMKMNQFTEVSAIVTHPNYTGKGYAKQLIAYATNNIFLQNKIPYLHVAETNLGAITLYKKLGFSIRRKISFWNFIN